VFRQDRYKLSDCKPRGVETLVRLSYRGRGTLQVLVSSRRESLVDVRKGMKDVKTNNQIMQGTSDKSNFSYILARFSRW
jgi:hypothetical protein